MSIRARIFGAADESPVVGAKKPKGASSHAGLHSVPIGREARTTNTRGEDRHRLGDEQVRITHGGAQREVQLVNLSGGGAMIEADFEPMLWDRIDLHLGENGTIECMVKWLKGGRIGLEFAHETRLDCSASEQANLLRDVIARSFPDVEFEVVEELDEQAEPKDGEQRGDRRHPLIWSGVIHHDYQSTPVRLRNISETGAMIECNAPLRAGSEPLLDLGEAGSVTATVTWVVGDSAGLRFHAPFDLTRLARSRPEVAPVKWEQPGYVAPGEAAADSPSDQEWGRMSLGELRQELEGYLKR